MEVCDHELVDAIYAVALNPNRYAEFSCLWNERVHQSHDGIYDIHFERASRMLAPHDTQAPEAGCRMLVDHTNCVVQANFAAREQYSAQPGVGIAKLRLEAGSTTRLLNLLEQLRCDPTRTTACIDVQCGERKRATAFVLRKQRHGLVWLTTTDLRWLPETAQQFAETFHLTDAEIDVVALLIEGLSVKEIAHERGASILTVRTQIRAIYDKTDAKSQCEVIRLALAYTSTLPQTDPASANRLTSIRAGSGRPIVLLGREQPEALLANAVSWAGYEDRPIYQANLATSECQIGRLGPFDALVQGAGLIRARQLVGRFALGTIYIAPQTSAEKDISQFEANAARNSADRLGFAATLGGWLPQVAAFKKLIEFEPYADVGAREEVLPMAIEAPSPMLRMRY